MARRQRLRLPTQEARFWSLVWEDPTCRESTWSPSAITIQPALWSLGAVTTEAHRPRAALHGQGRPRDEKLPPQTREAPSDSQPERSQSRNEDPAQADKQIKVHTHTHTHQTIDEKRKKQNKTGI